MSDTLPRTTLSVGQVAKRWGIHRRRVHALVRAGQLAAFTIPRAGTFGEVLRVPLAAVQAAEEEWAVLPARPKRKPPPETYEFKHVRLPAEPPEL